MQQPNLDFNQAVKYAQFAYLCGWLITKTRSAPRGMPTIFSATTTRENVSVAPLKCMPWLRAAASYVVKTVPVVPGMVKTSWRPSGSCAWFCGNTNRTVRMKKQKSLPEH